MRPETEIAVVNILRLDNAVTQDMVDVALAILRGERPTAPDAPRRVRLFLRSEIAEDFRVSKQTVSNWARHGLLRTVPNERGQTIGYTPESVESLADALRRRSAR